MEELLPGLVRIMEEKLGRFGRPLVIVVVISLALGAIAWGIRLFWDNAVSPISQFIQAIFEVQPITLQDFVQKVVTPLVVFIVLCVIVSIILQIFFHKKVVRPTAKTNEDSKRILEEASVVLKKAKKYYDEANQRIKKTTHLVKILEERLVKIESNPDNEDSETE
ncbi:hypothetical protein ACFLVK_01230 [Chloroflexota bacterium]